MARAPRIDSPDEVWTSIGRSRKAKRRHRRGHDCDPGMVLVLMTSL